MRKYDFSNLFIKMMDLRLSSAKLVELSGVSAASIHRFKNGQVIKQDSLINIRDVLHCGLQDILEVYDDETCNGGEDDDICSM